MILKGRDLEETLERMHRIYGMVGVLDARIADDEQILSAKHGNAFPYLFHPPNFFPFIDFPRDEYENFLFNLETPLVAYLNSRELLQLAELHDKTIANIASLEQIATSGKARNAYIGLLQDLLEDLRIVLGKEVVTSRELQQRVSTLLTTDATKFAISPEDYERLLEYTRESISIGKEFGGNFLAIPESDHWRIKIFEPNSIRLYNRHIGSYVSFLKSSSNGFWHTHHATKIQDEMTTDKKTKVAFSPSDYSYFEHAKEPLIVSSLDGQANPTVQIMVQRGIYCLETV